MWKELRQPSTLVESFEKSSLYGNLSSSTGEKSQIPMPPDEDYICNEPMSCLTIF